MIVNLYRDDNLDPNDGKTLIAAGLTAASGSYVWNTAANNVPNGTYYIYAEATDTWQVSGSYGDAPLIVSAPCTYSLTPTTGSVPNAGGASSFGLTTGNLCDWTAQSNSGFIAVTSSLVGSGSHTISYTVAANPLRTARTGTITAGGQTFTVTQLPAPAPFDFDGDGRADRTVYSPGSGIWKTAGGATRQFGLPGDMPVPGVYDGNGVLDTAVFRPSSGDWFVDGLAPFNWGRAGDVPMPADFATATASPTRRCSARPTARAASSGARPVHAGVGLRKRHSAAPATSTVTARPISRCSAAVDRSVVRDLRRVQRYTTGATYHRGVAGDAPLLGDFDGDGRPTSSPIGRRRANGSSRSRSVADLRLPTRYVGRPCDVRCCARHGRRSRRRHRRLSARRRHVVDVQSHHGFRRRQSVRRDRRSAAMERPQFHAPPTADFDGDHRADLTVFRPTTGEWFTRFSATGYATTDQHQWGLNGDLKVPGDYDGDGKTDLAVFRPSSAIWYINFSSTGYGTSLAVQWGLSSDIPVPADYDGDGRTDLAVFRPSSGEWYLRLSANNYGTFQVAQFGLPSDIPVPADYDGDGRADFAIFRPSTGQWFLKLSSGAYGGVVVKQFGLPSDVPLPSDWDNDGRADLAVFRPSTGQWFGADALTTIQHNPRVWGVTGDLPVSQDFDGDGVMDSAVFHPPTGQWFVKLSSTATGTLSIQWGVTNDQPLFRVGG